MKFKNLITSLLLFITIISSWTASAHTTDRKVYITDIVTAAGVPIIWFDSGSITTQSIVNSVGTGSNLDFVFGSTVAARVTTDSSGEFIFRSSANTGSSYVFYSGPLVTSNNVVAFFGTAGALFYGHVQALGFVEAGSVDNSPPATLNSYGSIAQKNDTVFTDVTLDANQAILLCDPTNNLSCGGTGDACSGYSYSACTSHSVYGCTQNTTGNCSDYNGDQITCNSHGGDGCSAGLSPCSTYNNDSANCSFVGCTFTPPTCAAFAGDPSTCSGAPGCTPDFADCSAFSDGGGDGAACNAHFTYCTYDSLSGACSGSYYVGTCSGSYSGSNGSCTGSDFFNGSCNGGLFGTCAGTGVCSNLTGSGSSACTASGCTWAASIVVTLPPIGGGNVSNTDDRTGWRSVIKNVGSGAVYVRSHVADSIEGSPSVTLASLYNWIELHPWKKRLQCSTFTDEPTCIAQTPCTWTGSACTGTYSNSSLWLKTGGS